MIDRNTCLSLFDAARHNGHLEYARHLATEWLGTWPGDRPFTLGLAEVETQLKLHGTATDRIEGLVEANPECAPAHRLMEQLLRHTGDPIRASVHAAFARALMGQPSAPDEGPSWEAPLNGAIEALKAEDAEGAVALAQQALAADIGSPLPAVICLRALLLAGDRPAALALARSGRDRWPGTIAFRLVLADDLLDQRQYDRAVAHLHQTAVDDPTGELTRDFLGQAHSFGDLWPKDMSIRLSRPVPSEVAAALDKGADGPGGPMEPGSDQTQSSQAPSSLGLTRQSAEAAMPDPEPWEAYPGPDSGDAPETAETLLTEEMQDVRRRLDRIAGDLHVPRQSQEDVARVPAYILLSSRTRLVQHFGEASFRRLDAAMKALVKAIRKRPGWSAYQVFVDDPASLRPWGLSPVDPANAWQIKLRLADLDEQLAQRGEMIGAVLIVGGHQIVPFHRLPNPTDDEDDDVPSDNPYATTDENYFAPEWPVGRLPSDDSPDLLVKRLRQAAEAHRARRRLLPAGLRLRFWLARRFGWLLRLAPPSIGYTASIWKKASMAVFRSIGEPRALMSSPPVEAATLPVLAMKPAWLSYFNLHGLEDTPEWFGQRDPLRDSASPDEFPVALRVQDVFNGGRAPRIVFTEACYGAHVLGKSIDTALSMKFLDSGSHAVIGSTKISYGSVTPPLIAADLLGRLFWEALNQSLPVGEALRRAKLQLAAEMHRRQGYLDGEDQKTMISFVLYGDPLYTPPHLGLKPGRKSVLRRASRPKRMRTVCAKGGPEILENQLDLEARDRVRTIVSRYLPGMTGATCRIHPQHYGCDAGDHSCPSHQLGIKGLPQPGQSTMVVSLSKRIPAGGREHPHFARLTLDPSGRVLKLAVSR